MATLTVNDLPDEVHSALQAQASRHGRTAEAEARDILARAVTHTPPLRMGDALAALGREIGLSDQDIETIQNGRDKAPATPVSFE
ncbi:plasmid stabilization protein [Tistrella mobilis]|uniref:FitA-like ribbon-helix-helix domain-containing protein n=1 Tax=Tistrella mobilis TaxID=171437 RepID=UPI003555FC08